MPFKEYSKEKMRFYRSLILWFTEHPDALDDLHAFFVGSDTVFHWRGTSICTEYFSGQDRMSAEIHIDPAQHDEKNICFRFAADLCRYFRLSAVCRHSAYFGLDRKYHPADPAGGERFCGVV